VLAAPGSRDMACPGEVKTMPVKTFEVTDAWCRCPKCGLYSCRVRRKALVRNPSAVFVEVRCLRCGHRERQREVCTA